MRNFFVKTMNAITALRVAGYDVKTIPCENGFIATVDLGLSPFDAPHWRRAITKEVRSIIAYGKSPWS